MSETLAHLLDDIYIRIGTNLMLYRQIVGIPVGTNCAPLIAYVYSFCYQRDSMASISNESI